ncbi:hypothetical protein M0R45_035230 [Rubus argutus]|uniref:Zinc knuckle CX2CX4HX4C domain-containing protein n=1 Tax=Rubus argutus TaxID=59490 RepID=A0AAW1VVF0_RUBAR
MVCYSRQFRVAPNEFLHLSFKYERLVGLCCDCLSLNHVGASCPLMVQRASTQLVSFRGFLFYGFSSLVFRANILPTLSSSLFKGVAFSDFFKKDSRSVVYGVRRGREEEVITIGKRARHVLGIIPAPLQPTALGLSLGEDGLVEVVVTTEAEVKCRGRPRGSRNKLKLGELADGPSTPG